MPLMRALARVRSQVPGEDHPQDKHRPDEVARDQDDAAVEAVGEDAGQRAREGRQETSDQSPAHGGGAPRDLDDQDHQRDQRDGVAHERDPLADPQPQKADIP